MKLERLISIVYRLLNNEVVSAAELAERYNVSQRTIYRDIEVLSAAGIPVVSYQGVNGGFGIIKEYKMDKSLLGSYDVGSLITLLNSVSTVFKDDRIMETIDRLQTIQHETKAPSMSMDLGSWREYNDSLRTLRTAITTRRVVRFQYINAKNERIHRSVEPVRLMYQFDCWYLYAYCRTREAYREFKMSRMVDLEMLLEHFERNHKIAPDGETMNSSDDQGEEAEVILHFSTACLAKALDHFYMENKSFQNDGSLVVKLHVKNPCESDWLHATILSFGDGVEIIETAELRRLIKRQVEKMLQRYSKV